MGRARSQDGYEAGARLKCSLFWVAKINDGEEAYFLQEATTELYASTLSAIAGYRGRQTNIIELHAKTARKVPKPMVGRVLSPREAEAVLKRFGVGNEKLPTSSRSAAFTQTM